MPENELMSSIRLHFEYICIWDSTLLQIHLQVFFVSLYVGYLRSEYVKSKKKKSYTHDKLHAKHTAATKCKNSVDLSEIESIWKSNNSW